MHLTPDMTCKKCLLVKPASEFSFYKRNGGFYGTACRACNNERMRLRNKNNPEKSRQICRDWYQKNKTTYNHIRTLRRRGITEQQWREMLAKQDGKCALCERTPQQSRHGRLYIDHCHESGRPRGLLCDKCNSALAFIGDTESSLIRALEYVRGVR